MWRCSRCGAKRAGLRAKGWVGIGIGFAGLLVLLWPGMRQSLQGEQGQMRGSLIELAGALSWTAGTILARRFKMPVSPFAAAGWQMLAAGVVNATMMLVLGDWARAQWGVQGVGAVLYLITFGSLVGYTAYIYLLEHVPIAKVATYAYVNLIVAVALGAIFLHERMVGTSMWGWLGILIIGVVTSSKLKSGAATVECVQT